MLAQSAIEHAAALENARQQFVASVDAAVAKVKDAARKAAASTWRGVRRTVFLAVGTIVVYAAVTSGLVAFWSGHQPAADVRPSGTCSGSQALPVLRHSDGCLIVAKDSASSTRPAVNSSLEAYGPPGR